MAGKGRPSPIQNFTHGIARSGKSLLTGVFDGVTGVVTKPIDGAVEEGVGGFFKGLGKGAIGLVTRPVGGVVDFASGTLNTVKRVNQDLSDEDERLRVPRSSKSNVMMRSYARREEEGNILLLEVEKGKYASTDAYLAHACIVDGKMYFLVTNNRIMYIEKNEFFGTWNIVWEYLYEEIKEPPHVTDEGLRIMLMKETPFQHKKDLFSQSVAGKMVYIADYAVCKWIAAIITEEMRKRT